MAAPAFREGLKDLKIKDGESLTLKCSVTGDPDPQIEWFKNDEVCISFLLFTLLIFFQIVVITTPWR